MSCGVTLQNQKPFSMWLSEHSGCGQPISQPLELDSSEVPHLSVSSDQRQVYEEGNSMLYNFAQEGPDGK